jgi:catechol 2,3-dioxygenase-like lactoylglutathione lyase family enzyme
LISPLIRRARTAPFPYPPERLFGTGLAENGVTETVMNEARVRYMVNDIDSAVAFYTKHLGFEVKQGGNPNFAMLSRGNLELVLSTPFGPGGAAKPMLDGRKAEPGGWNRIIINVENLQDEVERLRKNQLNFRSDILQGPGGSEVILDDPSGNPVELFQPASR